MKQSLVKLLCILVILILGNNYVTNAQNALHFDGSNDQIDLGTSSLLDLTNNFSLEAWVNITDNTSKARIFSRYDTDGWGFGIDVGGYLLFSDFGTADYTTSTDPVPLNTWTHVAFVLESNIGHFYVNGQLISTTTPMSLPGSPSANMLIGYSADSYEPFVGSMDEVRIWDRPLCILEIQNSIGCEIPTSETNLLLNLHFNQGTAGGTNTTITLVNDDSGNNLNGLIPNFAMTGLSSNFISSGASISGSCTPLTPVTFYLDGDNDGYGNIGVSNTSVCQPPNFVANSLDCDDGNTSINPATIWHVDLDGDLYYTGSPIPQCMNPFIPGSTYVPMNGGGDCDDSDPTVNPGLTEICGNGIDDDCAGGDLLCVSPNIQLKEASNLINSTGSYTFPSGVILGSSSLPISFSVANTVNSTTLTLIGTPYVGISGADAADFVVNDASIFAASGLISGGTELPFTITFTPSAIGTRTALLIISSDDPDEPTYTITLNATCLEPPEIDIKENSVSIPSGNTYDFSNILMNTNSSTIQFTIENTSTDGLLTFNNIPSVQLTTIGNPSEFTLVSNVSSTLAPSSSATFSVYFSPRSAGIRTAQVMINNNDQDEGLYILNLSGIGTISGDINGNGIIDGVEIAGDINQSGGIDYPLEITGDVNGTGTIDGDEISGDTDGSGTIIFPEIAGNTNGTGGIDGNEITGDVDGNGIINGDEFTGDINGNHILDPGEVVGDADGNGIINAPEIADDINGDGQIEPEPTYIMTGKNVIATNIVTRYEINPVLPDFYEYKWVYSDESMLMIKDTTRYFMDVIANAQTNSGTLYCIVYKFGIPYDTLDFTVEINKGYINVAELSELTQACANVYNLANKCEENYIDYFKLADIFYENDGCVIGGLQDLTNSTYTTSLEMGFTYSAEIKPKRLFLNAFGEPSTLFYALWIDYNNNGSFDDAFEYLKNGESKGEVANIINIVIANDTAFKGSRRLRVGMRSTGGFTKNDACSAVGESGEFEDYTVTLVPMADLIGPNFITPNNDGSNDILILRGIDVAKTRSLTIISSTGSIVYQKEDYANDWSGQGKDGQLIPKGTYYYIFKNGANEIKSYFELDY